MNRPIPISAFAPAAARVAPARQDRARGDAVLDLLLFGPDERSAEAGAGPRHAAQDIWLSSCDSVGLSPRAARAAGDACARVFGAAAACALPQWFDDLRRRIAGLFDASEAQVVLAASVVEAEFLFDALARAASRRGIVHIAAAPPERPEGGPPARFFPLRDRYGLALPIEEIDAEAARQVAEAVASGADVALHLADCSETGLLGPSRACVAKMEQEFPGRLTVLIDARQMRGERETIKADLAAGRAALLSGATFAGGPKGAAALLLPPALIARIGAFDLPGAAAFSAALDWPPALRERRRDDFVQLADLRLGLRWEAALAELECFFAVEPGLRASIAAAFRREVHRHLAASPFLKTADFRFEGDGAPALLPILTFNERGRAIKAEKLRRALADPAERAAVRAARRRPVRLGPPVLIGARKALRLALSAPLVNDVAERRARTENFGEAFQPLAADLQEAFALWGELAHDGL